MLYYIARNQHHEAEKRYDASYCDLDTLLSQSNFVCLILPLTKQTHYLIDADKLGKMKSGAILMNAGRGPLVDETALSLPDSMCSSKKPLPVTSPLLRACQMS